MKINLKALSLILVLVFCFALINTQKVYATSYMDAAEPATIRTNWQADRITLSRLDVDCYVLYTSRQSDEPSQAQMWRIPAGNTNVQDFNIPGTWWLHVYVPSTGQRESFGPYQKDDVAPPKPTFQLNTAITVGQWNPNVSEVSFQVSSRGDNGATGHDNINNCDSYFTAGFKRLEVWDGDNTQLSIGDSQIYGTFSVNTPGWHKLWARTVDDVDNYSEWEIIQFGIGPETEIPPDGDPGGGEVGTIKFDPDECDWTNEGKTGEGEGEFPVEVYYDGDNPYQTTATATVEEEDANGNLIVSEEDVDVEFSLDHIEVTGDAEDTVDGDSGTIYIENEGEGLSLHGEGFWGDAEYDSDGYVDEPDPPENPVGDSGLYNIDWTKPEIDADPRAARVWHNDVPYDVDISIYDELSGIDGGEIDVNDSSHYGRDDSIDIPSGGDHDFSETISLDDGIYSINVDTTDVATNDSSRTFRTYYVDGTQPEIEFNMEGKQIFSVPNGAIRKPSILGIDDSFYGTLSVTDNLSGAKSIDYKWTYGNAKPSSGYTRIFSSADTYYDRYDEEERNQIEKPVGDNLYLHVEVYDVAGNYTYRCFGPFEDPIKLLNYQITDVRDPRWQDVFWADDKYKNYKNVTFKANQLPMDEASHPTMRNAYPKKGYAFYFDITSEYLYREADRIEVIPTFYYNNIFNTRIPLDLYYNNDNNPLIKFGSSNDDLRLNLETARYGNVWIGGIDKLTLTKGVRVVKGREWLGTGGWKNEIQYRDGKIQWWYGKYLIPATSIFVRQGNSPRPENIINTNNIIVNFQIVAYKNGIETLSSDQMFTYVPNQWNLEGGPKNSGYRPGDVIVYDNKYSALSDFTGYVIQ